MLSFKNPTLNDLQLYFEWANDPEVRQQSYNSETINIDNHANWFKSVLNDKLICLYIFENEKNEKVGQVRIQKINNFEAIIGVSVGSTHRGKGYACEMLILATDSFFKDDKDFFINAYIKETNISSKFSFEKAGFKFCDMISYENFKSFHYIKNQEK
jgi:RimJ/RimL family protein N-acetyltransferase